MSDSVCDYVGCRVKLKVADDVYEGTVKSVDPETERISIERVIKNGKKDKFRNFFRCEISKLDVLDDYRNAKLDKEDKGPVLLGRKIATPHLSRMVDFNPGTHLVSRGYYSCDEEGGDKGRPGPVKLQETQFSKQSAASPGAKERPDCFVIIDQIDQQFDDVIHYLSSQSVLCIALEGVKLGRDGKLCWVQVATKSFIFLFDIRALGHDCFSCGLGQILTSSSIQKVCHDCRFVSDMLYHQYDLKMVNVFDTQVADVIIYRLKHDGDLPRYVNSLTTCLFHYLNISPEMVDTTHVRKECMEEDQAVWQKRPLPHYLLLTAARRVLYLRELRTCLMDKMMTEFVCGVDICLSHVRDATDTKLAAEQAHLLPVSFKDLSYEARRHIDFVSVRGRNSSRREEVGPHGFRENCVGVIDPHVIFSHDSIWHRGKQLPSENYSDIKKGMAKSASCSDVKSLQMFSSFGCAGQQVLAPPSSSPKTQPNAKLSSLHVSSDIPTEGGESAVLYKSYDNHELLTNKFSKRNVTLGTGTVDAEPDCSITELAAGEDNSSSPNRPCRINLSVFENDRELDGDDFLEPQQSVYKGNHAEVPSVMTVTPLQEMNSDFVLKPAGKVQNCNPRKKRGSEPVKKSFIGASPEFVVPQMTLGRSIPTVHHLDQNSLAGMTSPPNVHRMQGVLSSNGGLRAASANERSPGLQRNRLSPRQLLLNTLKMSLGKNETMTEALVPDLTEVCALDSSLDLIPAPSPSSSNIIMQSSDESDDQGFNSGSDLTTPQRSGGRGRSTLCRFTV